MHAMGYSQVFSATIHIHSKNPRVENRGGVYHIYVAEPPIEGKANKAVIAALAKFFLVAKNKVEIVGGLKSKQKKFTIAS